MMRAILIACSLLLCVGHASGDEPIEFENDVIPVLTKMGCNAGACHGAAIGRGGFSLSLYGGNPEADYQSIVRQLGGRRVNLVNPQESLVLLKPTEYLEHGGGWLFDDDSEAAVLLAEWIRQGASLDGTKKIERLEVTPTTHVTPALDQPIRLSTIAYYSDGSKRDVTRWTVFTAEDSSAVSIDEIHPDEVDSHHGATTTARVLRRGRHIVVARFATEVVPIELIVPLHDLAAEASTHQQDSFQDSFIDDLILEKLRTLGLRPTPVIGDGAFLRRVTLDLTGRLPTPDEVQAFVASTDPNKRRDRIDQLLESEAFTEHWTNYLTGLLRAQRVGDPIAAKAYSGWLEAQVRQDASYRDMARALLTASGDSHTVGPANFYRVTRSPNEQTEFFSELFMASRLRCANCHNHPLDRWTQNDYHGLAAIFARVDNERIVQTTSRGEIVHPATMEPALARVPGGDTLVPDEDLRIQLADWLTAQDNPFFAKAIVNRLWQRMLGRGLVEPVDDFRSTNPATHPALLDELAKNFQANDYSLRHTLRRIANSDVYARSADATVENKDDSQFYSHASRRPLERGVLARAIATVLDADVNSYDSALNLNGGLSQKLSLFNGPLLNSRIAAQGSRLPRLIEEGKQGREIIEEFYLVALARHPSEQERQFWLQQMGNVADSEQFLQDFVWGLLASHEFTTNH